VGGGGNDSAGVASNGVGSGAGSTAGNGSGGKGASSPNFGTVDGNGNAAGTQGNGAPSAQGGGSGSTGGRERTLTLQDERGRTYRISARYFRRQLFKSTADCMTAAYAQRLPLELCQ
jgi:hypothetical protein